MAIALQGAVDKKWFCSSCGKNLDLIAALYEQRDGIAEMVESMLDDWYGLPDVAEAIRSYRLGAGDGD